MRYYLFPSVVNYPWKAPWFLIMALSLRKDKLSFVKHGKRTDRELKKYFWNVTVSKGESQSGLRKLKRIACVS